MSQGQAKELQRSRGLDDLHHQELEIAIASTLDQIHPIG